MVEKVKAPKVSALMNIFRTDENYLRETIDSILNQTFTDFELLIVNDSPEFEYLDSIVESYKDKRIRYFKNKSNSGISFSRNRLISLSKGEYLAVIDHDDISLPDRFEKQVAFLDNNPDYGVVSAQFERFPSKSISNNPIEDYDIKIALMEGCAILHPLAMIRKSVLVDNDIMYDENLSVAEDYNLWVRLIPYTKFYNLPDKLLMYRWHNTNISKLKKEKMLATQMYVQALARVSNPVIYQEFLSRATCNLKFKLFGFIPLFKVISVGSITKIYLFYFLLIACYKKRCKFK